MTCSKISSESWDESERRTVNSTNRLSERDELFELTIDPKTRETSSRKSFFFQFDPKICQNPLENSLFDDLNLAAIELDCLDRFSASLSCSSRSSSSFSSELHNRWSIDEPKSPKEIFVVVHEHKSPSEVFLDEQKKVFSVQRGDQVLLLRRMGKSTLLVQKCEDGSVGFLPQICLASHQINSFLSLKGLRETVLWSNVASFAESSILLFGSTVDRFSSEMSSQSASFHPLIQWSTFAQNFLTNRIKLCCFSCSRQEQKPDAWIISTRSRSDESDAFLSYPLARSRHSLQVKSIDGARFSMIFFIRVFLWAFGFDRIYR